MDFFEKEGIQNLSIGHLSCPDCGGNDYNAAYAWNDDGNCPKCGVPSYTWNEPYFSHGDCDCCGDVLAGNRYHASGYNEHLDLIQEYEICEDCVNEYCQ